MAVPLSLIFAIQSAIVCVSFAIVIWMLTDQQQKDLESAITSNIKQKQAVTVDSIKEPFSAIDRYAAVMGSRVQTLPALRCGATIPATVDFFNEVVPVLEQELTRRGLTRIFQLEAQINATNGNDPIETIPWTACSVRGEVNSTANLLKTSTYFERSATIDTLRLPLSPILSTAISTPSNYSLSDSVRDLYTAGKSSRWSIVFRPKDGQVPAHILMTLSYPLVHNTTYPTNLNATFGLVFDVRATSFGNVATTSKISSGSKVMLFDANTGDMLATSGEASTFNGDTSWRIDASPDAEMSDIAPKARSRCTSTPCKDETYRTATHVISIAYIKPGNGVDLFLLQVTPEEEFFGESRKTRLNGILVGAGSAVIVVITCIVIWLAVHRPLDTLQSNMDLAANMQNDKAESNTCFLYEISLLNDAFEKMNHRLLQARAFMPQSVLCGVQEMDDDDEEEDEAAGPARAQSMAEPDEDEGNLALGGDNFDDEMSRHSNTSHRSSSSQKSKRDARKLVSTDRASHRSSASNRSAARRAGAGYQLALTKAISNRRIGVLIVNAVGFHAATQNVGVNVVEIHQSLVELVEGSSKAEKGVLDAFHGDHFAVTFNAALTVGAPAKGAALCALRIQNNLAERTVFPAVTMGLSAGLALVGTLGSVDIKKFCAVTPAFTQAIALEGAAKALGGVASCLFSSKISGDLDMHVYYQLVGQKVLPPNNINALAANAGRPVGIGGVMGVITTQGDEWLYELEEGASKNPFSKINAAFEMIFAQQRDRAQELSLEEVPAEADPGLVANWRRVKEILAGNASPNLP